MADPALPPGFTLDAPASSVAPILMPSDAQKAWDNASASLEQQIAGLPESAKQVGRNAFFNDPRIQRLRLAAASPVATRQNAVAGPPVLTKNQEIQNIARQKLGAQVGAGTLPFGMGNILTQAFGQPTADNPTGDASTAVMAGLKRGMFGVPERIQSIVTPDTLDQVRQQTNAEMATDPHAALAASLLSGTAAGGAAGSAISAAAPAVAPGVTNVLQELAQSSPKLATAANLIGGGAAGAGAMAVGTGDPNVGRAMLTGAIAAPLIGGGAKLLGLAAQKAAAVLNLGNAATILKRLTTATIPEMQAKLAEAQATGASPTLFELLPMQDRNKIASSVVSRSDNTLAQTQDLIKSRLGNIGPEMADTVGTAAAPARADATQQMADALETARGAPAPGDVAQAAQATTDPMAMARQPGNEAQLIMAPHDNRQLFDNISDIIPHHPELQDDGTVHMVESDPAISRVIRSQAGLLPSKDAVNPSGGLTGNEVGSLLKNLQGVADSQKPNSELAAQAVQHIEGVLGEQQPEYLAARQQMNAQFAARSRMVEGASEGMKTRTAASLDPNQITQPIRNAYGTPEGETGLGLGQANKLRTGFTEASPGQAVSQSAAIPGNVAAITQNLGPEAAGQISDAAAVQTQGARALAGLNAKTGSNAATLGPDDLASAVLGLNPAAMIRTKVMAMHKIANAFGVSEQKSGALVDMLFSTNPAKRQQVFDMLNRTPQGQSALSDLGTSLGLGGAAQQVAAPGAPQPIPALAPTPAPTDAAEPPLPEGFTEDAPPADNSPTPESAPTTPAPTAPASIDDMLNDPEVKKLLAQNDAGQTPNGAPSFAAIQKVFPNVDHPTSGLRSIAHNREVGGVANSLHLGLVPGVQAYDIPPQAGMTIHEAAAKIEAENPGVKVVESLAHRARKPDGSLGGYHWHFALAHA